MQLIKCRKILVQNPHICNLLTVVTAQQCIRQLETLFIE